MRKHVQQSCSLRAHASRLALGALALCLTAAHAVVAEPFPPKFVLTALEPAHGGDGRLGIVLENTAKDHGFGALPERPLDINRDGLSDVLVGATGPQLTCPRCSVFAMYGRPDLPPSFDTMNDPLDSRGRDGFIIQDAKIHDGGGSSITRLGDLNADGLEDFAFSCCYGAKMFVIFGRSGRFPTVYDAARLLPENGGDGSEGFIAIAPNYFTSPKGGCDVNHDGIDDLITGGTVGLGTGQEVWVLFGRSDGFGPEFDIDRLRPPQGDGSEGVVFSGAETANCLGDANGDDIDDLVIGQPYAEDEDTGEAFVVYGRTDPFPAEISLDDLLPGNGGDGSEGAVLRGAFVKENVGSTVASAGDMNGDGLDDIAIRAPVNVDYPSEPGRVYVVFGRAGGLPASLPLRNFWPENGGDGSQGVVLDGDRNTEAGYSLAGGGDVNADGFADLIIGAPNFVPGSRNPFTTGAAFVVFGSADHFPAEIALRSLANGDGTQGFVLFGGRTSGSVAGHVGNAGDVNGDGIDDMLISEHHDVQDEHSWSVYLVYGRPQ